MIATCSVQQIEFFEVSSNNMSRNSFIQSQSINKNKTGNQCSLENSQIEYESRKKTQNLLKIELKPVHLQEFWAIDV